MSDIVTKNSQVGRAVFNNAINTGVVNEKQGGQLGELAFEKQQSDQLGQLKRFRQVEGLPVAPEDAGDGNPYLNLEQKEFKHTQDT